MAGLYEWTGSGYTERAPRYWNGSAFVAPSTAWVWSGGSWSQVWPVGVTPWSGSAAEKQLVQDTWTDLIVFTAEGSGQAAFSVSHSWGSSSLQALTRERRLRITIDGVQVGAYATNSHKNEGWTATSTWTSAVADGQTIRIQGWANAGQALSRRVTVTAASMVPA